MNKINLLIKSLWGLSIALGSSFTVYGQEAIPATVLHPLSSEIKFDGNVEEDFWTSVPPLPLTMHWPNYAGELTEKTEVRIFYDDKYLYVGAICYDSEPEKMQKVTLQRDDISEKADHISLVLDPYNDNENSLFFAVMLTGSRADISIKNDAIGSDTFNMSWNSYWEAKTQERADGWMTEMRVPLSSLRFIVKDGKVEMGLGFYRYIARKREMQIYPDIPPDWGYWSFGKPSKLQTVTMEGVKNKRPWYTSPYILGGTGYHHEEDGNGLLQKIDDRDFQLGLDVQHAFTDNINADFTVNTDFAQVEADDQVVNLSRFSLFFPEKRKFFLERASTFSFQMDGNNNLFYSRRIGIEEGEMVPLYGGVRVAGRADKWDFGLINMQTRSIDDVPTENFGVLRLRRNTFNERSYLGSMFTSRVNADGRENYVYGLDGIVNVFRDDYIKFNWIQSFDSSDPDGLDPLDRSRMYLLWENRQSNGLNYTFSYSNVGDNYTPGIGFERRYNFSQVTGDLNYIRFSDGNSRLRQSTYSLNGETSFNNTTNDWETRTLGASTQWSWNRGNNFTVGATYLTDRVPEDFDLSDEVTIQSGQYENLSAYLNYESSTVGLFYYTTRVEAGSFYKGDLYNFSLNPGMILSKHLQFSGYYQYTNINFPDMNQVFDSHLVRFNMSVSLNVKWSMSTFAQLNTVNDLTGINFRLRYAPVDGNDFFLVFNEALNNDPRSVTPRLPRTEAITLLFKYVHTFRL